MRAIWLAGVRLTDRVTGAGVYRGPWLDLWLVALVLTALEWEALTSPYRRGPVLANVVVVGAMAVAGVWRRRLPLLSLSVIALGALVLHQGLTAVSSSHGTLTGLYCVLIPTYAVAAWERPSRAVLGLGVWLLVIAVVGALTNASLAQVAPAALTGVAVWVAGCVMQAQRSLAGDLDQKLTRLDSERLDRTRRAVVRERLSIARHLDAFVTDSVTEMVAQAQAADRLLDEDSVAAHQALDRVEATGRDALKEMRRTLGLLRRPNLDAGP